MTHLETSQSQLRDDDIQRKFTKSRPFKGETNLNRKWIRAGTLTHKSSTGLETSQKE
jgi:hypothetical protein